MNRESVELGFVLKQIPDYDFSMDNFTDRLKLQKTIYLLQAFGVYLGYDFSWYLRGPYCSLLADNGFSLQEIYDDIPDDVKLKNKKDREAFSKFIRFMRSKKIDELEMAASLHYLKQTGLSDKEAKERVTRKRVRFTPQQIDVIWKEIKALT